MSKKHEKVNFDYQYFWLILLKNRQKKGKISYIIKWFFRLGLNTKKKRGKWYAKKSK